ncbi:MAG: hypothetical protein ACE5JI_09635 [Acidobacteriota bacterium]
MTGLAAASCPHCSAPLVRSHRHGWGEQVLLAPLPFLRPYRCRGCGFRGLRWAGRPHRTRILLLFAILVAGALLIQLIWFLRVRAPEHPGGGYQPKDLERQQYLEKSEKSEKP